MLGAQSTTGQGCTISVCLEQSATKPGFTISLCLEHSLPQDKAVLGCFFFSYDIPTVMVKSVMA